jgi:hypothetical protein
MQPGLENYTFLTSKISTHEPNVYAGQKEQILKGFSNAPEKPDLFTLFFSSAATYPPTQSGPQECTSTHANAAREFILSFSRPTTSQRPIKLFWRLRSELSSHKQGLRSMGTLFKERRSNERALFYCLIPQGLRGSRSRPGSEMRKRHNGQNTFNL